MANMLDEKQAHKAVAALIKHVTEGSKKNELFEEASYVWLLIATKKISESNRKPARIPLKHSLYGKGSEVCLFTKDPQKDYKELLEKKGVKSVTKVIGVTKLRDNYKPFEAKRQLCNSYDVFLADDRVVPLLPKLIGKTFFDKKKQPIPVNLQRTNLNAEINRAIGSTYLHPSSGSCLAIKIGTTTNTVQEILDNLLTALPFVIDKVPKKWRNIQSLHIKTSESLSLPIYNSLPDEAKSIVPVAATANAGTDEE
ncbi:hypothetical protein BZG36_04803 [Bifiguratus adelaidae]|uniref:Ribosomal L1 domain-containing protein 1 n=1 Tax=Bifiguratus adelaidae TaxID=1938954 RepID=A0A261XV02_9FUNG|nr:hypothetical protein BZG36_04803 [Bifiguratus adelaidae]